MSGFLFTPFKMGLLEDANATWDED